MLEQQISAQIIEHMNDDHADAVLLYVRVFAGRGDATAARLVGFDAKGMDISYRVGSVESGCRIDFESPVDSAGAARRTLVEMAAKARAGPGDT